MSQKIQRKTASGLVQEKPLELLEVARRPGVGEAVLWGVTFKLRHVCLATVSQRMSQ